MLNAKNTRVSMKKNIILIVAILISFIAGVYFHKLATYRDIQNTMEQRYVSLKEDKKLIPIRNSDISVTLPKGMVIFFDFSHKDFYSYASIPIKTDFDDFRKYIENSAKEVVYELK
jgi:hypothetical protein